ncbi:hypothetical protein VNO80_26275 [Phaseolus coccineus]|uniref:Uncharacterized protein n=1 Tax=Phaseolus coccineus TaxID=3886 RepID=A0AAN9QKB5_PHACN
MIIKLKIPPKLLTLFFSFSISFSFSFSFHLNSLSLSLSLSLSCLCLDSDANGNCRNPNAPFLSILLDRVRVSYFIWRPDMIKAVAE